MLSCNQIKYGVIVMQIGYARVSTEDQDLGRQVQALQLAGCVSIFEEKISGGKHDRPELSKLLADIQPGDTLVVQKLDRLGRSLEHLLQIISDLKRRKIEFKSLSDAIDTNTASGKMMFQILGTIAEFERSMISERVKHSLAFKRSQGIILGRPKVNQSDLINAITERLEQKMKAKDIQKDLGLTGSRYHRLLNSQIGNNPIMG